MISVTTPRPSEFAFPSPDLFPRGSSEAILLTQVQNAIPFLFDGDLGGIRPDANRPFLTEIVEAAKERDRLRGPADFFRLALGVQWATCASFAPADVEPLIRFRLWSSSLPSEEIREMAETTLEAYGWDSTALSRRWISSPHSRFILSSHHGEWFAVATAAYAATRELDPMLSMRIREQIEFEVTREAKVYLEFRKARDGEGMLLAAGLISQNLLDLDRAIEGWELSPQDLLRDFAYRAAHAEGSRAARFGGALAEAGRMNRAYLAVESQRPFALRNLRALRRSPDLLLPLAPFLDDWGRRVATHTALRMEDRAAIVEALYLGWEKLKGADGKTVTTAYPRAVAGILEALPGGLEALAPILPPHIERNLRSGLFHSLVGVPEARFREQWATRALGFLRA